MTRTRKCGICGTVHPAKAVCAPNLEARRAGEQDRRNGARRRQDSWPPGTYGHADYELGYYSDQTPSHHRHPAARELSLFNAAKGGVLRKP